MTESARETLRYTEIAIDELKKTDFESPLWRLRWITTVTLMRAILHVCDKVDCADIKRSHSAQYNDFWNMKKTEEIFQNFIDFERNAAVKEFKLIENKRIASHLLMNLNGQLLMNQTGNVASLNVLMIGEHHLYERIDASIKWIKKYLCEIDEKFFKNEEKN